MSKSSGRASAPSKNDSRAAAAARAAQLRAAAAKKETQRKQLLAGGVAVLIVAIAVGLFFVISGQNKAQDAKTQAFIDKATSVPASAFDAAGAPAESTIKKVENGTVLKDGDKPKVYYVGGEFCPYCAGERWALTAALSRFGTVSGLSSTRSAADDGNIPTVSFKNLKFTSDYLVFQAWETMDRNKQPLQTLPADVEALMQANDPNGSIPWTFFGTAQLTGSGVPVTDLQNLDSADAWDQIATAMQTGSEGKGKDILSHANLLTAQICSLTGNKPENVCTAAGVVASAALLAK